MALMTEFKEFALRGNMVDMAVGIIIGAAFGKIVSSLVNDVIMPPIGVLVGGVDFSDLGVTIQQATAEADAVVVKYGQFLQTIIDFVIIALAIFFAIKVMNRLKRAEQEKAAEPAPPPEPSDEVKLLREIRDAVSRG